jgi:hypothetical protein
MYGIFFHEKTLPELTSENLTMPSTISVSKENARIASVTPMDPDGYLYRITAEPSLSIKGEATRAMAIISFKGVYARARLSNSEYVFDANPGDETIGFEAELVSQVPPIMDFSSRLNENYQYIVRSSDTHAPLMVSGFFDKDFSIGQFSFLCKVKMSFECDNDKVYSHYLSKCDDPDICKETDNIQVCGGEAEVVLLEAADCSEKQATISINYRGGRQWDVGETVKISFWKDTPCTRSRNDVNQLRMFCCPDREHCDWLGGNYDMSTFEPGGGSFGGGGATRTW